MLYVGWPLIIHNVNCDNALRSHANLLPYICMSRVLCWVVQVKYSSKKLDFSLRVNQCKFEQQRLLTSWSAWRHSRPDAIHRAPCTNPRPTGYRGIVHFSRVYCLRRFWLTSNALLWTTLWLGPSCRIFLAATEWSHIAAINTSGEESNFVIIWAPYKCFSPIFGPIRQSNIFSVFIAYVIHKFNTYLGKFCL